MEHKQHDGQHQWRPKATENRELDRVGPQRKQPTGAGQSDTFKRIAACYPNGRHYSEDAGEQSQQYEYWERGRFTWSTEVSRTDDQAGTHLLVTVRAEACSAQVLLYPKYHVS